MWSSIVMILKGFVFLLICVSGVSAQYDYTEVLHKSILFYEAQRSGKLPPTNRIPWRGDSALNDKGQDGEDLTGAWYDAGDYVKFGFPMAWSVTSLAWGILDFEQGYRAAGEFDFAVDSIKWPLDYFLKAHVEVNKFYGQVADGHVDHNYWGRPEDMTMYRPAWNINQSAPGSDLAAETAAAFAASSLVFRSVDTAYADQLLNNAKSLYNFAYNFRGKYSDSITNAASFYRSSGYNDELAWGATWLYRATNDVSYLNKAKQFYDSGTPWAFSWDDKNAGVQVLLYKLTGENQYREAVERYLTQWFPGGSVEYTPKGLAWRSKWGSLRYCAHSTHIALQAAEAGIRVNDAREWARGQIGYMLGDSGRSFVVGFGNNPPVRPHHAAASCPWPPEPCNWSHHSSPDPNPHILYGALVGGPGREDDYVDNRTDYVKNEVACGYNAGFQSSIAALKQIYG